MLLEENPSVRSFLDSPEEAGEDLPDWYKNSRRDAWMTFQEIDWPKRSDEAWRFANLKKLSYEDLCDAKGQGPGLVGVSPVEYTQPHLQ